MNTIQFGTLQVNGELTNVRNIAQASVKACPFCILIAEHYREDGSCKCNDLVEQKKMIKEWGYKKSDFKNYPCKTSAIRIAIANQIKKMTNKEANKDDK
jgi:hypothetical protein